MVIVGARCAGSPLAAMLARRGLRVCLLDRARFPSETLSTHVIQPCGVSSLRRLGALDAVLAAGAVPLTHLTLVAEDARIDATVDPATYGAPSLSVRRIVLDHLLVEAAASAGAEVRTETAVTGLLQVDGRVAGIETKHGRIGARLVVGADGRSSTVASLVGAREYRVAPPGRVFSWAYFEGVSEAEARLRLGSVGDLTYVSSPTDAGLHLAAVCSPFETRDAFLADREGGFMAGIAAWPELADVLAGGRRVGPIRVLANWHGYFREAAGPGWVLLGDAGHFKDPSPAQGISDALRHGERLADTVVSGLDGTADVDEELRRWWRWRDRDGYEMHWFATDMGAVSPTPLGTEFIREVAADEAAAEKLLRILNHDVPPSKLLTPTRLGRTFVRTIARHPRLIPAIMAEVASEARNQIDRSTRRNLPPAGGRRWPWGVESRIERMLLTLTVVGFVVPNVFVGLYLAGEGIDVGGYFSHWTASLPSTQLIVDLGIAAVTLFAWAAVEGPRAGIKRWWLCIPASFLVGLCFGLPLFLLMRERALAES